MNLTRLFIPFASLDKRGHAFLVAIEVLCALVLWGALNGGGLIPGPGAVLAKVVALATSAAFVDDLLASLGF